MLDRSMYAELPGWSKGFKEEMLMAGAPEEIKMFKTLTSAAAPPQRAGLKEPAEHPKVPNLRFPQTC